MKRIFRNIRQWVSDMARAFASEVQAVRRDVGVLIFFFVLPLVYPLVYTLIYNPEVVRQMPVAVVDDSRTAQSRELVRMASACPAIQIYSYCNDLAEARDQMAQGDVYGILAIPSDYARHLGQGEQATVQFYAEMSLLLRYRTFLSALTDLQMALTEDITMERIDMVGMAGESLGGGLPIESRSNFLGDPEQGFASFVIPGIVVLILQQSMLLGICMLGGTRKERRRRFGVVDSVDAHGRVSATVWGRALCFVMLYIPGTIYILRVVPGIFSLPHVGSGLDALIFIFPMLLATAFLGQTINYWMRERESAFIIIVFTSVLFLFLSGLTWPRYAMSPLWLAVGDAVPGTWGVEGFVRINSNAASLTDNAHAYTMLWVLSAIYMVTAIIVTHVEQRRCRRTLAKQAE